jgi:hypothetical protein
MNLLHISRTKSIQSTDVSDTTRNATATATDLSAARNISTGRPDNYFNNTWNEFKFTVSNSN